MNTAREKGVLAVMDATVGRLRDGVTRGDEILKSSEYSAADKAATRDVQARISADLQDNIEARATVAELIEIVRVVAEDIPHEEDCLYWRANISELSSAEAIAANDARCNCIVKQARDLLARANGESP